MNRSEIPTIEVLQEVKEVSPLIPAGELGATFKMEREVQYPTDDFAGVKPVLKESPRAAFQGLPVKYDSPVTEEDFKQTRDVADGSTWNKNIEDKKTGIFGFDN